MSACVNTTLLDYYHYHQFRWKLVQCVHESVHERRLVCHSVDEMKTSGKHSNHICATGICADSVDKLVNYDKQINTLYVYDYIMNGDFHHAAYFILF